MCLLRTKTGIEYNSIETPQIRKFSRTDSYRFFVLGLDIAGEHFDFPGFSHSSLRTQTCWFMRAFVEDGSLLFARKLIQNLGNFSSIRCPAKCAARISQAFSETTHTFYIDPRTVDILPDIERNGYTFTDGCGTVSSATWRSLKKALASRKQPTCYQIRYQGKSSCNYMQ